MRGFFYIYWFLQFDNVLSCWAFGTINYIKLDACTLIKGLEAVALNCGVMNENIFSAILLNKTKTLRIIKPFYCTFCHFYYSLILCSLWKRIIGMPGYVFLSGEIRFWAPLYLLVFFTV